ncbi:MAG TPA: hypothetical protein VNK81_07670 [Thermodesulfobacteriota bacterium]|jgi:epoxyqueuosine reductase QueG|nr:hypothetical protein [Thermodesulfobacteriota bacterium]
MNPDSVYKTMDFLQGSGFNLIRLVMAREYDKGVSPSKRLTNLLPDARSVILCGFAGRGFWETLKGFLRENPEFKDMREDWIDDYTFFRFMSVARTLDEEGVNYRMVFPFGSVGSSVDFLRLGEMGGVGVRSLLGILIHPEYGSWISLRGAIVTDLEFREYDTPISYFNPCPTCSKPCISVCPAGTVSKNGWDYRACMGFRLRDDTCRDNCSSRRACPYGKGHEYSEEQLSYHHRFVLKRVREYRDRF